MALIDAPPPPATPNPKDGFPDKYPFNYSVPLPSALLRPLKQPLFDTIDIPAGKPINEVLFFQVPMGNQCMVSDKQKEIQQTNLCQPGQLANPLEFSVFGFGLSINGLTAEEERDFRYSTNLLFLFTGNRIYLNCPAELIPEPLNPMPLAPISHAQFGIKGKGLTEDQKSAFGRDAAGYQEEVEKMREEASKSKNFYSFAIGATALRIRPAESFGIRLRRTSPIEFKKDWSVRAYILGMQWTPM